MRKIPRKLDVEIHAITAPECARLVRRETIVRWTATQCWMLTEKWWRDYYDRWEENRDAEEAAATAAGEVYVRPGEEYVDVDASLFAHACVIARERAEGIAVEAAQAGAVRMGGDAGAAGNVEGQLEDGDRGDEDDQDAEAGLDLDRWNAQPDEEDEDLEDAEDEDEDLEFIGDPGEAV